jgi:hypothetical protein
MDLLSKLQLVLADPRSKPPDHPMYGQAVKKFTVSKIFSFNGKPWQLRSIRIKGIWRIFPFIIDSGGPQNRLPIISEPILKKFHLERERDNQAGRIAVPSPFGYSQAPLTGTWGDSRAAVIQAHDMKFNAFGSDEARAIDYVNFHVQEQIPKEIILQNLTRHFPNFVDLNVAKQEIDSLEENVSCEEWSVDHIPISPLLFD